MNITLTVNFTGTSDDEDAAAAVARVDLENEKTARENYNRDIVNQTHPNDPPLPPLPLLATTPNSVLKTNYLALLTEDVVKSHGALARKGADKRLETIREKYRNATETGKGLAEGVLNANQRP